MLLRAPKAGYVWYADGELTRVEVMVRGNVQARHGIMQAGSE